MCWMNHVLVFILFQAPRPSTGPHKMRECLPLVVFLRNRLKYALTYDEVKKIVNQRLIKVDGKVRTDKTYPAGFMGEHPFCLVDTILLLNLRNLQITEWTFIVLGVCSGTHDVCMHTDQKACMVHKSPSLTPLCGMCQELICIPG